MNLEQQLDAWIANLRVRSGRSASTGQTYRRHVTKALTWIDGKYTKTVEQINYLDLDTYLIHLEDSEWLPNSRRVTSVALRSFFRFASSCDWIPKNPSEVLKVPKPERREVRTLTIDQTKKVIFDGEPVVEQSPLDLRNRLIFALSYQLGLRGELELFPKPGLR